MKNLLLIAALFTLITTTSNAQKKLVYGVKGGATISNMASENFYKSESKTSFYVGLVAEYSMSPKFSIQPEIIYARQKATVYPYYYCVGFVCSPRIDNYTLDYIQVPVLAKLYVFKNLSVELGPSFNFLVHSKEVNKSYNNQTTTNIGKTFEFSGVLGISYKLKNGLFASARYTKGFSDVLDGYAKNSSYQLGIGYFF